MLAVIVFEEFETKTGGRLDVLDITDDVNDVVLRSKVHNGSVLVFSPHTTCTVSLGKPGTELASTLESLIESLAPADGYYAHDDLDIRTENLVEDEPPNAPAHIFHAVFGSVSETIPVVDGVLRLGEDQRILFVELDSSRERRYCVQVVSH